MPYTFGTQFARPGLECKYTYNGLTLNDKSLLETYILTNISGFEDADIEDNRQKIPERTGEIPGLASYGGRTIILEGFIRAGNTSKLRQMQQNLSTAFADLTEKPLLISYPTTSVTYPTIGNKYIMCRKSSKIDGTEQQDGQTFRRKFMVTLRASDPRVYDNSIVSVTSVFSVATKDFIDYFSDTRASAGSNYAIQSRTDVTPYDPAEPSTLNGAVIGADNLASNMIVVNGYLQKNNIAGTPFELPRGRYRYTGAQYTNSRIAVSSAIAPGLSFSDKGISSLRVWNRLGAASSTLNAIGSEVLVYNNATYDATHPSTTGAAVKLRQVKLVSGVFSVINSIFITYELGTESWIRLESELNAGVLNTTLYMGSYSFTWSMTPYTLSAGDLTNFPTATLGNIGFDILNSKATLAGYAETGPRVRYIDSFEVDDLIFPTNVINTYNSGNYGAPYKAEFKGPLQNPKIIEQTTSKYLALYGTIPAGMTLTYDSATGSVTDQNGLFYNNMLAITSNLDSIAPGGVSGSPIVYLAYSDLTDLSTSQINLKYSVTWLT